MRTIGVVIIIVLNSLHPLAVSAELTCRYVGEIGGIAQYYCKSPSARDELTPLPRSASVQPGPISIPPNLYRTRSLPQLARDIARRYGVEPELVTALITVESGWNTRAVSPRGAKGLMQLMPETQQRLGVRDAFDPVENIDGGVRHLKSLLDEFGGNKRLALAAYNTRPELVRFCRCVPPIPETQEYVRSVLTHYGRSNT